MGRDAVLSRMLPLDRAISVLPRLCLNDDDARHYLNGMTIKMEPKDMPQKTPIAVFSDKELIGISQFVNNSLKPIKVFS